MSETPPPPHADLVDRDSFAVERDGLSPTNPLEYPDYERALEKARAGGNDESVQAGAARIGEREVEFAAFDFPFLGGSMGMVAGERLARAMERAAQRRVPFVLRTATGGARMQEGMRALVQMPKVVAARIQLAAADQPFIAVLGHPTTGGVLASLGGLADITAAEAEATIGFAGPRVAERFTGRALPRGSHTATSAFRHGLVDEVVPRSDARTYVVNALNVLAPDDPVTAPGGAPPLPGAQRVDAWESVVRVRDPQRPTGPALTRDAADLLVELRGDRQGTDDPALFAALARVAGRRVVVLALDRTHPPGPGAYRKAMRCVAIARRLSLPVVTLIDTRGADPSADSEAGGIAWAIASLFEAMLEADVPTLSVVTGEGGSGGALAFAATDRVVAYADSIFSVIGPEGAAEILWRDGSRAPEAARLLKLTAPDLLALGVVDAVVDAPLDATSVRGMIAHHLATLDADRVTLAKARRARWRSRG